MGFSGPYPILIKKRPLGTLAGLNVLLSLIVHLLLITATQLALWYYIKTRQWLVTILLKMLQHCGGKPHEVKHDTVLTSYDTTVLCVQ